ncbi:MAG TPA: MGMT family protein [Polyangiaceae bacterium]|nr:MGMT family protein [Polyangiaceae bacterium]
MTDSFERIRRVVGSIPRGRVMTYGDVARAAGMPGAARAVGYAMRALGREVPWQRVLGRKNPRHGHITIVDPRGKAEQRRLLEKEGVSFDARGGVALATYGWVPSAGVARRQSSSVRAASSSRKPSSPRPRS